MEINKIGGDFFADNANGLPEQYDFNKDGTVNIEDYRIALIKLNDDDPDNDVKFTKEQLDDIFADVISRAKTNEAGDKEITDANAQDVAKEMLTEVEKGIADPSLAKSFDELQKTGEQLCKYIKQCSQLLPILNAQIEAAEKELEEIQEEKDAKEKEYKNVEAQVNEKNDELAVKMNEVLSRSESVTQSMQANTANVIAKCVEDYKNGEYPDQDLYSVITQKLGENCGESISVNALRSTIDECGNLGAEIKVLCSDIETIVADIRSVTQKYNDKTSTLNGIKEIRNGVLDASSDAAAQYQKGYQKRLDLRQEVVDKYYVQGNGTDDISNPQLGKITEFLDNNEMENLPFADCYAILQKIAGECGITFRDGDIIMPTFVYMESESEITSDERQAMAVFNRLSDAINARYGSGKTCDTENEGNAQYLTSGEPCSLGTCTQSSCCDPMTFKQGGQTFHFVADNNGNGIFDNESEFLGAQNGWDEMKAYDADGDGKINGDELKNLKLVATNDENGQFTFMDASQAGINEIDLSTYNDVEEKQVNGDVLQGTFDIKMNDGSIIKAQQTDDAAKNIEMNYSNLFGSEIKDLTDSYENNPFMDEFLETTDTTLIETKNPSKISSIAYDVNEAIALTNLSTDNKVRNSSSEAKREKTKSDEDKALEDKKLQMQQETKKTK